MRGGTSGINLKLYSSMLTLNGAKKLKWSCGQEAGLAFTESTVIPAPVVADLLCPQERLICTGTMAVGKSDNSSPSCGDVDPDHPPLCAHCFP